MTSAIQEHNLNAVKNNSTQKSRSRTGWSIQFKIFLTLVLVPPIMALLYYGLIASSMYISEAKFAVRSSEATGSFDFAATLFKSTSATMADAYILSQYIQSLDIAQSIDSELNISNHFSNPDKDIISRLWQSPTQDELLKYWQWLVTTSFDPDTGILAVKVKAYSPEMAQHINAAILKHSEALVNEMNNRAREDAVGMAKSEVSMAENRLSTARTELKKFRDTHTVLDPKATAAGMQSIVTNLEGEGAKVEAELAEARAYMRDDAPRVVALKTRLDAIKRQLSLEKRKLANLSTSTNSLSAVVADYERFLIEEEFAQKLFVSAMTALETARLHASSKSRYVVAFQRPSLPDESLYPQPLVMGGIFFVGSLVCLGLFSLIFAAIREHAGF
jgi:capsular polysaccharide transport system permease protein